MPPWLSLCPIVRASHVLALLSLYRWCGCWLYGASCVLWCGRGANRGVSLTGRVGYGGSWRVAVYGWGYEKMFRDFPMTDEPKSAFALKAAALAAKLPSQLTDHSWACEPYLVASNPDTQNPIDLLMDDVCAEWAASFARKPSIDRQQAFIDCGSVILANLMRAKCNRWPTTIGMRRGKGALDRERQYRPNYMKAALFITVQDWLMKSGYVEMVKSGFNLPGYSQTSRFALTERGVLDAGSQGLGFCQLQSGPGQRNHPIEGCRRPALRIR